MVLSVEIIEFFPILGVVKLRHSNILAIYPTLYGDYRYN